MTHQPTMQHTTDTSAPVCRSRVNVLLPKMLTRMVLMLTLLMVTGGCEPGDQPAVPDRTPPAARSTPDISPYRLLDGSHVTLLPEIADDAELAAAIDVARSTLPDAMRRWHSESDNEQSRTHWAIKWAAVTVDGGHEHLWVRPTAWTEYRIEGIVLSKPTAELLMARTQGDVVSFPPDDVTDWVHLSADKDTPMQGGFTLALIESRARRDQ